ncbi:MAG: hypothetical protein KC492_43135 [Myxococcales bacterium]|nr:hypothetical protein [Myxococcales bacterium]
MLPFASTRAQDHWRPEFTQVKPPSEQLARRATDPPPGFAVDDQTVVDDLLAAGHLAELRASDPRMKAEKPVFHSLWDDDEKTEFTEINRLLDQLPPDVREVMTRWRKVRAERLSTERKRAAAFAEQVRNSGRPPPMPSSTSGVPSSSAAADFRSNRWVAVLGIATLVVAVVLTLLVVFSGP